MKKIVLICLCLFLMTGCKGRDLEDCSFPTVLPVFSANIAGEQKKRQEEEDRYREFGHVKAVILSENTLKSVESLKTILQYLEENPAFARNLLVFSGNQKVLEYALSREEEVGSYLEKNDKVHGQEKEHLRITLKDVLNAFHNNESVLFFPKLQLREGHLRVEGVTEIQQTSVKASNIPIQKK